MVFRIIRISIIRSFYLLLTDLISSSLPLFSLLIDPIQVVKREKEEEENRKREEIKMVE